jgi:hypothetical protein
VSPSDGPKAADDTPVTGEETEARQPAAAPDPEPDTRADTEPDAEAAAESPGTDAEPVPGLTTESDATPVVEPVVPVVGATANRQRVLLFSAAAVVVLVVVGVVVYLLTRDDSTNTAGPEVPTIEGSAPPTTQAQAPPASSTSALAPQSSASATAAAGTDAGAAQSVAEEAAAAISEADVAALVQLSCDPAAAAEGSNEDTFPTDATVEVVGEPQITGDTATVDVRVTLPGAEPATVPMPLTKQGERWCIP